MNRRGAEVQGRAGEGTRRRGDAAKRSARRRVVFPIVLGVVLLAVPLGSQQAEAQQAVKLRRIGYVSSSSPNASPLWVGAFRDALGELGYVEGRDVVIEYRWAEGRAERLPGLVGELVRLKVDLIFAIGTPAALAAKEGTKTIPIVFAAVGDPVGTGIIASLARPGGNATGLANVFVDISAKLLEVLKEAVPGATRVAILAYVGNPAMQLGMKEAEAAAKRLGAKLTVHDVRRPSDLDVAFGAIARERPGALFVFPDAIMFGNRSRIVEFAAKHRLPAMYPAREFADDGGLMSYGTNFPDMHRRAAAYADKIFKGAKPADLPVEQPTRFELVVNLKTAKALGLTIPQSVLIRADQVIQ